MKSRSNEKRKEKKSNAASANEMLAIRELTAKQKDLRKVFLSRLYKGAEIIEIRKQIEDYRNHGKPILMQWYGMPFPEALLTMEHDIVQNIYTELLMEEKGMKEELKVIYKLTDDELQSLLVDGKFVKEVRK